MTAIPKLSDVSLPMADFAPERICLDPIPGTATLTDVIEAEARTGRLYELIDGIIVEKTVGFEEGYLGSEIFAILREFVKQHDLGLAIADGGMAELFPGQVRTPDAAFYSWDKFPNRQRPKELVPDLAIEVLSPSNRPGEMFAKLKDYYFAGVKLVWYVDPRKRTIEVYTSVNDVMTLTINDTLDGGTLLPGFSVAVATIFA